MRLVFRAVIGTLLTVGGAAALAQDAAPALARDERMAIKAAQDALGAKDYATAGPAISTAISTAHTGYARYLAASLQLKLGEETNDRTLQARAIQAMIESGAAPAEALEELYKNQGALALAANNGERAESAFKRWTELAPNNPEAALALAEVEDDRHKIAESVSLIQQAIHQRQAAGQPVPESWYKRGLRLAFDAQLAQPSVDLARELVQAYPSPKNWRDALLVYRDAYHADPATSLDALRLARAAKALAGERDYLEYVQALDPAAAAERKAVLDEGVAAKMVDPRKPQFKNLMAPAAKKGAGKPAKPVAGDPLAAGDAYLGAKDYGKAAEAYRAALAKGAADANVANLHLGMALALAGQRAEAEAALRSVTGARAPLASYWLAWLAESGRPA